MEWDFVGRKELSFSWLEVRAGFVGKDVLACIEGGEAPHIGCAVLAVPRLSLTGDGSMSATSSVLNVTGHKDEALCRAFAETISKTLGVTAVCTGGFHMDGILPEQIKEVAGALNGLAKEAALCLALYRKKEEI